MIDPARFEELAANARDAKGQADEAARLHEESRKRLEEANRTFSQARDALLGYAERNAGLALALGAPGRAKL